MCSSDLLIGETLNIMTLGGLALAVGILVDDATVTIENINYHLEQGKPVEQSILDGANQIVTPAFVSLLCICIVFVPMFFLTGVARFLFVPMAEAVMFAMIWSFILSRTLVPTMANYLLQPHVHHEGAPPKSRNPSISAIALVPSKAPRFGSSTPCNYSKHKMARLMSCPWSSRRPERIHRVSLSMSARHSHWMPMQPIDSRASLKATSPTAKKKVPISRRA